jgi:hypothetical protein
LAFYLLVVLLEALMIAGMNHLTGRPEYKHVADRMFEDAPRYRWGL